MRRLYTEWKFWLHRKMLWSWTKPPYRTKQPIVEVRQNYRFLWQGKTADFNSKTKSPIVKTNKIADFASETKPPFLT